MIWGRADDLGITENSGREAPDVPHVGAILRVLPALDTCLQLGPSPGLRQTSYDEPRRDFGAARDRKIIRFSSVSSSNHTCCFKTL